MYDFHHADAERRRWVYTQRGYALAQSLLQLQRHQLATVGTLLVLGITLTLPAMLFFSATTLTALSERGTQGESLTAYLNLTIDDLSGAALAARWKALNTVASTRYISKAEALATLQSDAQIRAAIDILEDNPLPGAIVVFPQQDSLNSAGIERLARSLQSSPEVDHIQFDLEWIKRLDAFITLIRRVGFLLGVFLTLTALVVIINTIRLEIARRQDELEVARLLGASTSFMRRPILYTGALYGLLSGLIACLIATLALKVIQDPADKLSSLYAYSLEPSLPDILQILQVMGVTTALGLIAALTGLHHSRQQITHH